MVSGLDMTREAALVKLMFLLGQGYDHDTVRALIEVDQRGEQSYSIFKFQYGEGTADATFSSDPTTTIANWEKEKFSKGIVRFKGLRRTDGKSGTAVLRAFLVLPPPAARCAGV